MTDRMRAYLVHLLTATGAVFSALAILAAADSEWRLMWFWLLVAFVVDGIDGPLARRYDVMVNAPRIDGALMDLIIDYLTYVMIPAYALYASGVLPGWTGWAALGVVTFGGVLYFADTKMKTADKAFSGFPGCFNMAVLVVFALMPPIPVILGLMVVLTAAMFLPLRFVHPVRTKRWRTLTLPVAVLWTTFAAWSVAVDFDPRSWAGWSLAAASVYLLFVGIAQQIIPPRD